MSKCLPAITNRELSKQIKEELNKEHVRDSCKKTASGKIKIFLRSNMVQFLEFPRVTSLLGTDTANPDKMTDSCYDMLVNLFSDMIKSTRIPFNTTSLEIHYLVNEEGTGFLELGYDFPEIIHFARS